jgi:hypothetical protein
MSRVLSHVRHNVVAYLALFVALGGTSYAAVSLPRNSVGAPQIKNHSITPVKFNGKSIAGSVRAWVILQWRGSVIKATSASGHVTVKNVSSGVTVTWPHHHFPPRCLASATPQVNLNGGELYGFVTAQFDPTNPSGAFLALHGFQPSGTPSAQAADVLIVCPS